MRIFDVAPQDSCFVTHRLHFQHARALFFQREAGLAHARLRHLVRDANAGRGTLDFDIELFLEVGNAEFELADLRVVVAQAAAYLFELPFLARQVGTHAADERVAHHFLHAVGLGQGLGFAAARVICSGLNSDELGVEFVEALGFDVQAFVCHDQTRLLLECRELGLRCFKVVAHGLGIGIEELGVLFCRPGFQFHGRFEVGLDESVRNGSGEIRVGAGEVHVDHVRAARRPHVEPGPQDACNPGGEITLALGLGQPLRAQLGQFSQPQRSDHALRNARALQDVDLRDQVAG